jgi:hypothetical protein
MHFTCRSFIGKNTAESWSQYWENEPDDQLKNFKGHLFGLINLSAKNSSSSINIGHDLIFEINQNYFSTDSNDNIIANLQDTLNSITKNPLYFNYQLKIILLVVLHQQVFVASFGDGKVILQRSSQISLILSGETDQITTISGPIKSADRLFLTTLDFFEKITWNKIKTILVDENIQNIEENFLSLLYSFEDQNQLSAVLIEIHEDIEATEIPESSESLPLSPDLVEKNDNTESADNNLYSIPSVDQPQHSIFVNHQQTFKIGNHKKVQIIIAFLLIVGLLVSSYFGYRKNQTVKTETQYQTLRAELDKKLSNISVVKSLNMETAYQAAKESQNIVNQMVQLNIHQSEVSQFKSQISTILSQTGDSDNFSPDLVYDTSLIVSQPAFSKIITFNSNLYLLDSNHGRLDSLNVANKSTKNVLISDQIKSFTKILVDNNNFYLASSNGLSLVDKTSLTSKIDFQSITPSISVTDLQFWNGSLYVLDNSAQSIWKITPNSTGYGSPVSWLKNNAKLGLGSDSLTIDGKVWVLSESGQITAYLSGIKDNFQPNQTTNFSKTSLLNTAADSDLLAFVDDSKFIYVYKKTGELVSKFNLSKFKIIDLTLDSVNKVIYFLASDQKIYKISL